MLQQKIGLLKNKQLLTYKKWNTLKRSIIAAILLVALLAANTSTVHADSGPPWAQNVDNLSYTEQEGWKKLDTDVSVTSDTNDFTNGYVEVHITDATDADSLQLVNGGSLSVSGDAVYWGDDRIGSIDNTYDGSDGRLRINFSAVAPLTNADFETGDLTGWTVDDTANQMQGQAWAEGPDALEYTADSDPTYDDQSSGSNAASVIGAAAQEGSYGLKLEISGSVDTGYGTGHAPSVMSSTFAADVDDTLSLKWYAAQTSDYYDVFGFVFADADDDGNWDNGESYQKLFHDIGSQTDGWETINATLTIGSDNLRFIFINGTYDQTGGLVIGSYLYIDGIELQIADTTTATNTIVESVIECIEYRNTSDDPATTKNYNLNFEESDDGTGVNSAQINITPVNDAPTDISLSNDSVEENQSIGTVVGTLSSTDADSSEFTYSLVSGDTDEFSVNSNQLLTAAVFDYESTTSYSVEVRSNDGDGGTYDEPFTINVADVADETDPDTASVTTPVNGTVYNASTIPPTFSGQAGDDASGSGMNANSATFYVKDTTDTKYWDGNSWEDDATWLATTHDATSDGSEVSWSDAIDLPSWTDTHGYEVKAKAIDKTGNTLEGTAITFTYDTTAPTISGGVLASDNAYVTVTFDEGVYNTNGGSGALETSDFSLTFTQNSGNATAASISGVKNNSGGALSGGETVIRVELSITGTPSGVETVEVKPAENSIYDAAGNPAATSETTGAKTLNDQLAPTISGVTSAKDDGAYTTGEVIDITVTFSETVNVTGDPYLELETGSTDRNATYQSGTGTATLTFRYTVQAGDTSPDLDYKATDSFKLNGGTIKDGVGNDATLTLPAPGEANSLGANKALVIYYNPPPPPINYQPDNQIRNHGETDYIGDDIYNTNGTDQTKSQAVTSNVTAIYEIKLQNDATGPDALNVTGSAGGSGWTVTYYSVTEDADVTHLVTEGIWYARNCPSGDWEVMRLEVTPDSTVPPGSFIEILITSASAYSSLEVTDAVRAITTATYQPDNQIRNHGETDYIGDDIYNTDGADQTKSQAVTDNVTAIYEIKLQNDATGIDTLNVIGTAGGSGWTVTYYSVAEDADVTDLITEGIWYTRPMLSGDWEEMRLEVTLDSTVPSGSSIEVLITSTSTYSDTYDIVKAITTALPDTTPPAIVSTSPAAQATDVAVDTTVSVTFSEAMDASTITISSFTLDGVSGNVSYDSDTYTATFTPDANLAENTRYTATLSTTITDVADNPLAAESSWSFTTKVDVPPTVSSVSPLDGATYVATYTTVTATFDMAMDESTITISSFALSNGGAVSGTVSYDSGTYTATFTPDAKLGSNTIYTAMLSTAITSADDIALVSAYSWSFTTVLVGDATEDGIVDARDVTKVERIIGGLDSETAGADADQDGNINALDITKIERIIAGLD